MKTTEKIVNGTETEGGICAVSDPAQAPRGDIVERLRARKLFWLNGGAWMMGVDPDPDCAEAADKIERLRECLMGSDRLARVRGEQIERLRAALRPFAIPAECWATTVYADDPNIPVVVFENGMRTDRGHFDAARRALEGK